MSGFARYDIPVNNIFKSEKENEYGETYFKIRIDLCGSTELRGDEWHRLLLDWVSSNMRGQRRPFLLAPYNWRTYGDMNMMFWKKHQNTTLEEAKAMLEQSHREVMELAETFTEEELFQKGSFQWVGGSTLASFFAADTASHYNWAMKKLKAHRKNCKNG